jgi:hypothetical protein
MKVATLLILLASLNSAFASNGGDGMGNGGGLREQNFTYAWLNLGEFVDHCLADPGCATQATARELLLDISASMPAEFAGAGLRFESAATHPEHFASPLAQASSNPALGTPLYINIDLDPVSIGACAQALIAELGKRHASDLAAITEAAEDVRQELEKGAEEINLSAAGRPRIREVLFQSALVLFAEDSAEQAGPAIQAALPCSSLPKTGSYSLSNLHWDLTATVLPKISSQADIRVDCGAGLRFEGNLALDFVLSGPPGFSIVPASIQAQVTALRPLGLR